jgi:hypothetical protein
MTAFRVVITPEGDGTAGQGQAAIRVETSPAPRIVEITITATAVDGRSAASLPTIDLDGVIRALAAGVRLAAEPVATPKSRTEPLSAAPAAETPPASQNSRKGDRPYRQMPDPAELQSVLDEVKTVTGVAAHYEVPRHTAQGWVTRLRKSAR